MLDNTTIAELLANEGFVKGLKSRMNLGDLDISKADTISQATNLLWYDLRPVVQMLYPYKELIPLISRLPRVEADGGNAYHWKRITAVNTGNISIGVSEGNRGARIAITEQDQQATYKTLGLESSVTFEARLGSKNLVPDAIGTNVSATLRSLMIGEEQTLILGNASTLLGQTPTPTLSAGGTGSNWATGTAYVICVALSGLGWLGYTAYNNSTLTGGVPGQITKVNSDGTTDTFGGGSAKASTEASVAITSGQALTCTVAAVPGAVAYAWFAGTSSGGEYLRAITAANKVVLNGPGANTNQPVTGLKVGGVYVDNSVNTLLPDGMISQIFGSVFGTGYVTTMGTNPNLPAVVTALDTLAVTSGGSLVYTKGAGNTGLTIAGSNISEFDAILQAAYDQYKVGFDRVLMSSTDILNSFGLMLSQTGNNSTFRILFDADERTGRIVAGRRVTSYLNKFMNNTLEIEVHPFVPPGTVIFWSDRVPYELAGVANILEAHVRQDYYQIQWPFRARRYEYGVYADEVFSCYFTPGFAIITNLNPSTGVPTV